MKDTSGGEPRGEPKGATLHQGQGCILLLGSSPVCSSRFFLAVSFLRVYPSFPPSTEHHGHGKSRLWFLDMGTMDDF